MTKTIFVKNRLHFCLKLFLFCFLFLNSKIIFAQEGAEENKKGLQTEQLRQIAAFKDVGEVRSNNPLTISAGADFASRDILRGIPGNSFFSVLPLLSIDFIGFSFGTCGSYPLSNSDAQTNEFWLSYVLETDLGSISTTIYDYHLGTMDIDFFNFKGEGNGSHLLELQLEYAGSEVFPIKLLGAYNFHNDPDNSLYFEIGYNSSFGGFKWGMFLGGTKGKSELYGIETNKIAIINTGFSISKEIKITDSFSLPFGVDYVINPYFEKSYLVFKVSL